MYDEIQSPGQENKTDQSPSTLAFDAKRYDQLIDDAALSAEEKEELLRIIWNFMMFFVDAGFGMEPTQVACGKLIESHLLSEIENKKTIESSNNTLQDDFNIASTQPKEGEKV